MIQQSNITYRLTCNAARWWAATGLVHGARMITLCAVPGLRANVLRHGRPRPDFHPTAGGHAFLVVIVARACGDRSCRPCPPCRRLLGFSVYAPPSTSIPPSSARWPKAPALSDEVEKRLSRTLTPSGDDMAGRLAGLLTVLLYTSSSSGSSS